MGNIEVKGAETLFEIGPIAITQTIVSMILVTLILAVAGILLGRKLKKRPGSLQVLTEKGVSMLTNLVVSTMGAHNVKWVPYIGTIFLSSLLGSLIGLTGFLRSTTADLAVVLAWALMTSGIIWYQSIKHKGVFGWLKGFTEPIVVMTPMNIVSEIAQPVAMAFRHFGNVAGGSIITSIIYTALATASTALLGAISGTIVMPVILLVAGAAILVVAYWKKNLKGKVVGYALAVISLFGIASYLNLFGGLDIPILQFGLPGVLSIYFDLFSGFVQAFVFSLLSMVYIAGACPPPEEQNEEK